MLRVLEDEEPVDFDLEGIDEIEYKDSDTWDFSGYDSENDVEDY